MAASNDPLAQFEQVVARCQSEDNDIRGEAEKIFFKTAERPDSFFTGLTHLLVRSSEPKVRIFCAVMMRQYLEVANPAWGQVSGPSRDLVQKGLLQQVKTESERPVRLAVAGAVGALAVKMLMPDSKTPGQWPQLLPTLMELSRDSDPGSRESSLRVFEVLLDFCGDSLMGHLASFQTLLSSALQDADGNVKLAALKTTISLFLVVPDEKLPQLQELVPMLFHTLGQAYQKKDDDLIQDTVKVLSELAEKRPRCLKDIVKQVVMSVAKVAQDSQLDEDTRLAGLEFLVSLAEAGKGMVRKVKEFPATVIPIAFAFMLHLEVSPEWERWEDDDDEDQKLFKAGEGALGRLAEALRGKSFLPVAWKLIEQFAQQRDRWSARHAALMGIAMAAEGCQKQFQSELPKIVSMVTNYAQKDPHFRVRYAATYTLAMLAQLYQQQVLSQYCGPVLPILCANMAPNSHPRLVEHTALCLVEFYNAAKTTQLLPPALTSQTDLIAKALVAVLSSKVGKLQSAALSALNAMALVIEKEFTRFYPGVMRAALTILQNATSEEQKELRAKALETVGCASVAVGPETVSKDLDKLMPLLLKDLTAHDNLAVEDPTREALLRALGRLAETMGAKFEPYLKHIIPVLLRSAALEDVARVDDGTGPNELANREGYITQAVNWRGLGTKRFTVNTTLLEEKRLACELLYAYSNSVGSCFFPYVMPMARLLLPLINFPYNEHVRLCAISATVPLLQVITAHAEETKQNHDALLSELFNAYVPQVVQACEAADMVSTIETGVERMVDVLDALADALTAYPLKLSQPQIKQLVEVLAAVVTHSTQRRTTRVKEAKEGDFDEAAAEELAEYEEEEDELLTKAYHVVAALSKTMKAEFFPLFHKFLFPVYAPLMAPPRSSGEQCAGLCVIGQVVNDCLPASKEYVAKFHGIAFNYARDPDHDVRQSALFGLGACAMAAGPAYLEQVPAVLQVCAQVVEDKDSRSELKHPATCCAMGAVAKVIRNTLSQPGQEKQQAEAVKRLLTWLPGGGDEEEARQIHQMLLEMMEENSASVWGGPQKSNLAQLVRVFGTCLETDLLYPKTEERFQVIWKKLCSALTPQQLQQLCGELPQPVQKKLADLRTVQLPRASKE
eukprot:g22300.t1